LYWYCISPGSISKSLQFGWRTEECNIADITKSYLTDDQLQTGINLIQSFEDIFVKDDINIGNTHVKHRIDLNDDRPFKQRNRRIPPTKFETDGV
jgi:hypothetical protein